MKVLRVLSLRSCFIQALCFLVLGLSLPLAGITPPSDAQSADKPTTTRKIVTQVPAIYPPDLKRASIGGTVRLIINVNPRGGVGLVQVAGGNPILAEAAVRAVKQWKYVPAAASTNIRVELRFDPSR